MNKIYEGDFFHNIEFDKKVFKATWIPLSEHEGEIMICAEDENGDSYVFYESTCNKIEI